jgi:hypothetical protein
MNHISRRSLIQESAALFRDLTLYRGRLCELARQVQDPDTLGILATIEERVAAAQRSLSGAVEVLVREREGRP